MADHPKSDTAALQLGLAYQEAGDRARAEVSFRQAIALRPDYWSHWLGLGTLLWQAGDLNAARTSWEKSAELAPPEITWPLENLGTLAVAQGDAAGALAYFDRIPRPINDPFLAGTIGNACFYANRLDDADENYRLAVRLMPSNAMFHANLGDLLARRGEAAAGTTRIPGGRTARRSRKGSRHGRPRRRSQHRFVPGASGGLSAGAQRCSRLAGLPADRRRCSSESADLRRLFGPRPRLGGRCRCRPPRLPRQQPLGRK